MQPIYHLPRLPFSTKDVKGAISKETLHFHHKKHHQAYVDKTNELLAQAPASLRSLSIEDLVKQSEDKLFNQSSQMWAHTFFWHSLTSKQHSEEGKSLFSSVAHSAMSSWPHLQKEFLKKGKDHFGSGWLWLVQKKQKLEWVEMHDAQSPLQDEGLALMACDLWEHAYYLDYQNDREAFLSTIFPFLNWEFAATIMQAEEVPDFNLLLRSRSEESVGSLAA